MGSVLFSSTSYRSAHESNKTKFDKPHASSSSEKNKKDSNGCRPRRRVVLPLVLLAAVQERDKLPFLPVCRGQCALLGGVVAHLKALRGRRALQGGRCGVRGLPLAARPGALRGGIEPAGDAQCGLHARRALHHGTEAPRCRSCSSGDCAARDARPALRCVRRHLGERVGELGGLNHQVETRGAAVNASFSDYYCQARGTLLCADPTASDGEKLERLVQVFGTGIEGSNSNSNSTSASNEAMASVFIGCKYALVENKGGLSAVQQEFLKSYNTSDAVDVWCGNYLLSLASPGSEWTPTPESNPVSIVSTRRFNQFVYAWNARLANDVFSVGLLCVFVPLMGVGWLKIPWSEKIVGGNSDLGQIKYTLAASSVQGESEEC